VTRSTLSRYDHLAEYRRHPDPLSSPDQFGGEAPLNAAAALLLIILLSIGLWRGILWAVSSFLSDLL